MNILIIGGTRFMGPLVARRLHQQGHEVTVFHRGDSVADLPGTIREVRGDRTRLREHGGVLRSLRPDIVIDMILRTESEAKELVAVLGDVARRFIVISSCDVYQNWNRILGNEPGPGADLPLLEDSPLRSVLYPYRQEAGDASDPMYAYDKIPVERKIMSAGETTVLRMPIIYGPNDYQHRFYEHVKRMVDGRPVILLNETYAEWRISRGYRDNCAEAVVGTVTAEKAAGRIYNVAEPAALSEREWIQRIAPIIGWSGDIVTLPNKQLPGHLRVDEHFEYDMVIDTARIREELGYREPIDPETALRRTIDWLRSNPPEIRPEDYDYAAEDAVIAG